MKRGGLTILTFFALVTILFTLFRMTPGDVSSVLIPPGLPEESRQILRQRLGLDQPFHIQYLIYLKSVLVGDFGQSFLRNKPVGDVIFVSLSHTLTITLPAVIVAHTVGPVIGAYLAWRRGETVDTVGVGVVLMGYAAPIFWTAMLALMVFSYWLGVFPSNGMHSVAYDGPTTIPYTYLNVDFLQHLALPLAVTIIYYLTAPTFFMRNTMIEVLGSDFIDMKRSQGLTEFSILYKHAARNSLLPVLHYFALAIGYAFGGAILVETVFSWPGIGRVMWEAVLARDYPLAQGAFLLMATIIILMNFLADVVSVYIDPRVADEEVVT